MRPTPPATPSAVVPAVAPVPVAGPRIHLGTQGWNYDAWTGAFYPTGTRAADYLAVYARAFGTVEVDATFYAVPSEATVRGWAARTPPGFRFALKLPQALTHERHLRGGDDVLESFLDRARLLGPKLGPVLVQLGPDFGPAELPALARFLPKLPGDVHFAVEFRDRAWLADGALATSVLALLADHGATPALSDGRWIPRRWIFRLAERMAERVAAQGGASAGAAYVRWMGANRDLVDYSRIQIDRTRELDAWADVLRALAAMVGVYGYVNNHFAGHSPQSVRDLQRRLGQPLVPPEELGEQLTLL
ncbi:hypothetical protein tb265_25710 [Gemmatimonadetes bacterium T265]|nr:hypothetical protein tb265_25710 [Gemmatimonadetes bacterium T265]